MKRETPTAPTGRRLFQSPRVYKNKLQLRVPDWPAWDRERWLVATGPVDILAPGAPLVSWRPATVKHVAKAYGRWLQWLNDQGKLTEASRPSERVTEASLAAFVADIKSAGCVSISVVSYLNGLAMALDRLEPSIDHAWIWDAMRLQNRQARPSRRKWERVVSSKELFEFGMELLDMPLLGDPIRDTVRMRDGLIIALLAACPLRVKNLQMMDIGTHLIRIGKEYQVTFEKDEMKKSRYNTWALPIELTPVLEDYLNQYRPFLLGLARATETVVEAGRGLWISRFGTRMAQGTLTVMTKQRTDTKFGKKVNVHLFRDCAATTIAWDNPDNPGIAMEVLGHSSPTASERSYNHALSLKAFGAYHAYLAEMAKAPRPNAILDEGEVE